MLHKYRTFYGIIQRTILTKRIFRPLRESVVGRFDSWSFHHFRIFFTGNTRFVEPYSLFNDHKFSFLGYKTYIEDQLATPIMKSSFFSDSQRQYINLLRLRNQTKACLVRHPFVKDEKVADRLYHSSQIDNRKKNENMNKLSVVVITFNEEKNIERCLESVKEIADEVIVVDSYSTDNTQKIVESRGAIFIENSFEGHRQQKNFALQKAKYDYVLSLDADEVLSVPAILSLKTIKSQPMSDAYSFNRKTNYCGKWIQHCGWYPDRKIRLINRKKAKWGGVNPHDKIILNQGIKPQKIEGDILHYSFPTISSHIVTADFYSEISSKEIYKKDKTIYFIIHILLNPLFKFFKKYFVQLGILDGFYGFVICVLSAYSNFLKYTKTWQLYKEKRHQSHKK